MVTQENCVRVITGGCQKKTENGILRLDFCDIFEKFSWHWYTTSVNSWYSKREQDMNVYNKIGRRAAGTWGRPRRKYAKRMSAKAIRRLFGNVAVAD